VLTGVLLPQQNFQGHYNLSERVGLKQLFPSGLVPVVVPLTGVYYRAVKVVILLLHRM
jgi:hypothetical protein